MALPLAGVGSSARSAACSACGKNLIKDPGAEGGHGQTAANDNLAGADDLSLVLS